MSDNTSDATFFGSFGLVALVASLGCFVVWSENAVKRGIGRAKLLVDNKADVKAKDQVNLRVISLTHTSSMFPRCCRIAGTPLCRWLFSLSRSQHGKTAMDHFAQVKKDIKEIEDGPIELMIRDLNEIARARGKWGEHAPRIRNALCLWRWHATLRKPSLGQAQRAQLQSATN